MRSASIVGVQESNTAVSGTLAAAHQTFLKAVNSKGKSGESNVFISPSGEEAVAFVGIGGAEIEESKMAENVRQAVLI